MGSGTATGSIDQALAAVRERFLDDTNRYGCAETAYVVLKAAYGLPEPDDSAAAMALNGGVAWSGGICGAISGAALAVGELAEARSPDHATAKRRARETMAGCIDAFAAEHGAVDCRALLGLDIRSPDGHRAFIESGVWRTACLARIGTVVARLAELPTQPAWSDPPSRSVPARRRPG